MQGITFIQKLNQNMCQGICVLCVLQLSNNWKLSFSESAQCLYKIECVVKHIEYGFERLIQIKIPPDVWELLFEVLTL